MSEPHLVTDQLTKSYGRVTALCGCSFAAARGEVVGLLGPNGAGKTTLLRLLMGFLRPTSGAASIEQLDCYRHSVTIHARAGYLPGEVRLERRMNGLQTLQFFSGVHPHGDLQRAVAVARQLELDLSRQVARSSTGMRQKLALAVVLSLDVPLLILDEPTSHLDPTARDQVLTMVRQAQAEGRTILFSSHVLSEVEAVCDRAILLNQGRIAHTQDMAQLRRRHLIRVRLSRDVDPLPDPPGGASVQTDGPRRLVIQSPDELSPLLAWLAELPTDEVRIEPVGLKPVYDRYIREPTP